MIQHTDADGSTYVAIHEVHYDDKGVPVAYTENPTDVLSEDLAGLRWQLNHMTKCLEAVVLTEADFTGNKEDL